MMLSKSTPIAYGLLIAAWLAVVCWQIYEHNRVEQVGRDALRARARDISTSVGVVIRSQARFGGAMPQPRLEAALEELTKLDELEAVALLNADGECTVSAGGVIDLDTAGLREEGEYWGKDSVTIVNLVDLGVDAVADMPSETPPIVMPVPEGAGRGRRFMGPGPHGPPGPPEPPPFINEKDVVTLRSLMTGKPLSEEQIATFLSLLPEESLDQGVRDAIRSLLSGMPLDEGALREITAILGHALLPPGFPRPRPGPGHGLFQRMRWMDEAQYEELIQKRGVHWFVLSISKKQFRSMLASDLGHRVTVCVVALLATIALGMAFHGMERSALLTMRLVRADEMNAHLRDMNLAAAGLAHETKNPLNIVRGLAQTIAQDSTAPEDTRARACTVTEEVDRVTERLNRFMDYSRPLEVHVESTGLKGVIQNVLRVLETDIEDKSITCAVTGPGLDVEADETLLRQVVFNLLLNAVQFTPQGGRIEVVVHEDSRGRASFEIRDSGPGVPKQDRKEIFRPYFTTSENGVGLGLAVVRQIVLAHQWDIEYVPGNNGANFRITGLKRL